MSGFELCRATDVPARGISQGIEVRVLREPTDQFPSQIVEVSLAPGAVWDGVDEHTDAHEIVRVVSGVLSDENGDHRPGTVIVGHRGSRHTPRSAEGCVLFVVYPYTEQWLSRQTRLAAA
ncbi:cupin domain-containing protein [Streptomyces sp. NPDC059994]|uniref:cupin domain-containing protein n=1 Tax=Streptomyces sp. NPDC059994 TaxID=3347029 RepID=UPI0036A883D7